MKAARKPPQPQSPSVLLVPSLWVAAGFVTVSVLLFRAWWDQSPVSVALVRAYWQRDAQFLSPVWSVFATTWGRNVVAMVLLAAAEAASWALGRCALRWALGVAPGRLWGALLALGLGNGLLGVVTLALGFSGLLMPGVFWVLLLAALCLAVPPLFFPGSRTRPADDLPPRGGEGRERGAAVRWIERALIGFCALIVVGNWLPALMPEWFYDSMVYHLAVPEQHLLQHKVGSLSHTFFSNFPFLQEMRYLFFLTLGSDIAPALLHWADGVLAAAAVYALAEVFLGRTAAWLAAAIFLSQPTLKFLQPVTMVELGLTWFEVLATMAFVGGMGWLTSHGEGRVRRGAWFLLVGWFLGFAQGTKYLGLFASVLLLGWLGVSFMRSGRGWRSLGGTLGLIIGWASLWMGIWLAKNWLFTGDPFFPFLHTVFPALNWDESQYQSWMHDNTKYGTGHGSLTNWLKMPVMASIGIPAFGTFTLNPFPLLFLPFLLLYRHPLEPVRFLAVYAGLYFVLWASSSQQTRFLYPMVAQAAVAIAFVVTRLGASSWLLRGTLGVATAWILVVSAYGEVKNRFSNTELVPYMTGHLKRAEVLRLVVSYYDTMEKANEVVGKRSRLLFIGGDESFYCKRRRVCNSNYDRPWLGQQAERAKGPKELLALLRRQRITHLLLHEPRCEEYAGYGIFDWGERAKENFLRMWHTYGHRVFFSGGVLLFELTAEPIPLSQRKTGRPSYFYPPQVVERSHELIRKVDTLFQRRDPEAAYRTCEELVRLIPGASHAYFYRGYASELLNRRREAIADYETAIRLGYPPAVVHANLGRLLEGERKYPEALKRYLEALELDPKMESMKDRIAQVRPLAAAAQK